MASPIHGSFTVTGKLRTEICRISVVIKRLPENRGEFEYCIKNLDEPYARIVRESELTKA